MNKAKNELEAEDEELCMPSKKTKSSMTLPQKS